MTCDNCARLTRELREAREELAEYRDALPDTEDHRVVLIAKRLGIQPQGGRMAAEMADRNGRICTTELLGELIGYGGEGYVGDPGRLMTGVVRVNISRLRKALERAGCPGAVVNYHGTGYALSEAGVKLVRKLSR